jgi:hypothetical protein
VLFELEDVTATRGGRVVTHDLGQAARIAGRVLVLERDGLREAAPTP